MNPVTHFLAGWLVANVDSLERRDRALVTAAAVIPDIDGLGLLGDVASGNPDAVFSLYGQYHHVLAHNVFFGVVITVAAFLAAKKKWLTAFLVLLSFHTHLAGDILSGRGPDGTIWSVSFFFPVGKDVPFFWPGQWELNAWPNVAVTAIVLSITLYLAWRRGFSPVGLFSRKADQAFIHTLRGRFPRVQ
jgi:inner membrane protein